MHTRTCPSLSARPIGVCVEQPDKRVCRSALACCCSPQHFNEIAYTRQQVCPGEMAALCATTNCSPETPALVQIDKDLHKISFFSCTDRPTCSQSGAYWRASRQMRPLIRLQRG